MRKSVLSDPTFAGRLLFGSLAVSVVVFAVVALVPARVSVSTYARIEASRRYVISPEFDASVSFVVANGTLVDTGDVVVVFDTTSLRERIAVLEEEIGALRAEAAAARAAGAARVSDAERSRAIAAVESSALAPGALPYDEKLAEARLAEAEAEADAAKMRYESVRRLYDEGYASKREVEFVENRMKAARAAVERAAAELAKAREVSTDTERQRPGVLSAYAETEAARVLAASMAEASAINARADAKQKEVERLRRLLGEAERIAPYDGIAVVPSWVAEGATVRTGDPACEIVGGTLVAAAYFQPIDAPHVRRVSFRFGDTAFVSDVSFVAHAPSLGDTLVRVVAQLPAGVSIPYGAYGEAEAVVSSGPLLKVVLSGFLGRRATGRIRIGI